MERRFFIQSGLLGSFFLSLGSLALYQRNGSLQAEPVSPLGPKGEKIILALAPAYLEGLAQTPEEFQACKAGVNEILLGLSPLTNQDLQEFFYLLDFLPTKLFLIHSWTAWDQIQPAQAVDLIQSWQKSKITLLNSAAQALGELILASFWADPKHYALAGYPGPIEL